MTWQFFDHFLCIIFVNGKPFQILPWSSFILFHNHGKLFPILPWQIVQTLMSWKICYLFSWPTLKLAHGKYVIFLPWQIVQIFAMTKSLTPFLIAYTHYYIVIIDIERRVWSLPSSYRKCILFWIGPWQKNCIHH